MEHAEAKAKRDRVAMWTQRIGDAAAAAFLVGNTVSSLELENLTGLDLLPKLDAESLKRAVASELWPRS